MGPGGYTSKENDSPFFPNPSVANSSAGRRRVCMTPPIQDQLLMQAFEGLSKAVAWISEPCFFFIQLLPPPYKPHMIRSFVEVKNTDF